MRGRQITAVLVGVPLLVAPLAIGSSALAIGPDTSPPSIVSVSSTDYPSSDSGATSTLHAGQPGRFTIDAADVGGGLRRVEWQLDDTLGSRSRPYRTPFSGWQSLEFASTASTTVTVTPPRWGTTILSVRAIDRGGQRSQITRYVFYVPFDPRPAVPGDVTSDGIPDVVTSDSRGDLRVYPGTADGTLGASYVASTAAEAPGDGWVDALVTHRGNSKGGGAEELLVWTHGVMDSYDNVGIGYFGSAGVTDVEHPPCSDCAGYPRTWADLTAMVALGGDTGEPRTGRLLTIEAGRAWLYPRYLGGVDSPHEVMLGGVDLVHADLVAPGDVTGDGVVDLWVRDRQRGSLTQFTGTTTGFDSNGTVLARSGYAAATFPVVTSVGDLSGDGVADLLTLTRAGSLQRRSVTALTEPVKDSPTSLGRRAATVENQRVGSPVAR